MSETRDGCGDAAAYLLGALDPSEAEQFRRHVDSCIVCRDELSIFQNVVDVLPTAVPQHRAPRALRRRVMRDVRLDQAVAAGAPRAWRRRLVISGSVLRPALVGALAAAVMLAVVGGVELAGGGPSAVRVIRASVTGVAGSAHLRIVGRKAELVVSHLPPPPAGRIYELWIKHRAGAPSPTSALFSVTAGGAADVGVPGDLHGVTAILVTAEPAGGSRAPTRPPLIVARLA